MSTSKGNLNRNRPQKHQNRTAFKNDLHDTSKKTKTINSLNVSGVCKRCKEIIEWKIKYKKYKPLTAPAKCTGCEQKAVRHAYHVLCSRCAKEKNVCAKCNKPAEMEIQDAAVQNNDSDIKSMLKTLPERKRRTILRQIEKKEGDPKAISEMIEGVMSSMDDVDLSDDFCSDEEQ